MRERERDRECVKERERERERDIWFKRLKERVCERIKEPRMEYY